MRPETLQRRLYLSAVLLSLKERARFQFPPAPRAAGWPTTGPWSSFGKTQESLAQAARCDAFYHAHKKAGSVNDSREACLTQTHPYGLQDHPDRQRPRHNGSDWQRVGRALKRWVGYIFRTVVISVTA